MYKLNFPFFIKYSFKSIKDLDIYKLNLEELRYIKDINNLNKRDIEFCLGRLACQEVLKEFGIKNTPVLRGKNNEPIFPKNIVGSISHKHDIAIALCGLKDFIKYIGVDIEEYPQKFSFNIINKVCNEKEKKLVIKKNSEKYLRLLLIFSAKESIYKALFPSQKIFLSFKDVVINEINNNELIGILKKDLISFKKGYIFKIKYMIFDRYILTYIII